MHLSTGDDGATHQQWVAELVFRVILAQAQVNFFTGVIAPRESELMYRFIVTIHARPAEAAQTGEIEVAQRRMRTLQVPQATLAATRMNCTFETACERLAALERMFCEPDGSFVWTSARGQPAWQVDGNLYDYQGRLQFVDLSGTCPAEHFDRLLAALGWPETPLVFQLTREGVLLDEAEFRRFAAGD